MQTDNPDLWAMAEFSNESICSSENGHHSLTTEIQPSGIVQLQEANFFRGEAIHPAVRAMGIRI
jgi:hypothetical protein